jgi:hypothetical protein
VASSTDAFIEDEREGYVASLQGGLFENDLETEVEDAEPCTILSRSQNTQCFVTVGI